MRNLIEEAALRLQELQAMGSADPWPDILPADRSPPRVGAAVMPIVPRVVPQTSRAARRVDIDFRVLSARGMLTPETARPQLAAEYRILKRPLIRHALGKHCAPTPHGRFVMRANTWLQSVPVILLSSRAGKEFRVGGLDAGADDYVAKPFSSRELVARVGALIEREQLRRTAEQRLRNAFMRHRRLAALHRDFPSSPRAAGRKDGRHRAGPHRFAHAAAPTHPPTPNKNAMTRRGARSASGCSRARARSKPTCW